MTFNILHARKEKERANIDCSHLIGCADYKMPQVMRCYGALTFSNSLASKVDNEVELKEEPKEEVEIRANVLKVIDYIYKNRQKILADEY